MRLKSRVSVNFLFILAMFLGTSVFAAPKESKSINKNKDKNETKVEVKSEAKLPFYFPEGVVQTADPVKQMQEYVRYITATYYKFQGRGERSSRLIPGSDSIVVETNIDSTTSIASDKVQKCKIVLDHFVRMPDGRIRVTQLADQFYITEEELRVVVDDLTALIKQASEGNFEFYKDLADTAMKARAAKILTPTKSLTDTSMKSPTESVGVTAVSTELIAFKKMLEDKDPIYQEVTIRDLHYLPKPVRVSDFVPKELHLGYNVELEGILGVCWLNSGVIYYNPQARILDYLTGRPKVLQHEMVHCNYNLEKFPFASGFDAELFAMFPEVFFEENKTDLFFHHYCADLRELCEIYFGFDFTEARKQIFKYNLAGSTIIDEAKYKEYFAKVEDIKKELAHVVKNYIIPEFYSDPLWWSSMNDKLRDKNSLFWIMMAKHYKPTILGTSKENSARETSIWISAHHEEIMQMAKKSYNGSGMDGKLSIVVGGQKFSQSLIRELSNFLAPEDRKIVSEYFEENPRALEKISKMSINQAVDFIKTISRKRTGVMDLEK
jgi:hypothetical protein